MRGSSVRIVVRAEGVPPEELTINVREHGSDRFQPWTIKRDTGSTYVYTIPGITRSVDVYAQGAWLEVGVRTDTAQIIVLDRPLVRTLRGRVTPPAYTRMASTELTEQEADVTALAGSVVDLSVQSNKELRSATLVIARDADSATSDTVRIPMQVAGASARGRFAVNGQGTYSIEIVDRDGTRNQEPPTYRIVALTDAYPTITLVQPTQDVELTQQATVSVVSSITDDYGFTRLRLYYRLQSSRYAQPEKNFRAIDIPLLGDGTVRDVPYIWNLAKIDVTPEDTYEMYLEVADNDIVRGPKTARTRSVTVRMPSLDEVFAQADKTQTEMQRELKNLAKEAEDVRKEAEQLQRELQRQQSQQKQDVSWSDKKKAEELMQRQEQLQKRMDKVAETMEQMTEKLQQNKAISQETLQKYMELQKLMKEVKTPELQRMQEQM
jgi:prefoldin subunit 5